MKKLTAQIILALALAIPAGAETVNESAAFATKPFKVRIPAKDDWIQQIVAYQVTLEYDHLGRKVEDIKSFTVRPTMNQESYTVVTFDIPAELSIEPKATVDRLVIAYRWTSK